VVDCSVSGLALALSRTAPDGVCTSAGSLHRSARIPLLAMYARNVTLHVGRAHVRALMPEVLALMSEGRLAPGSLPAVVAPLDAAPSVLSEHFRGGGVKAILTA
ncbi:MAG TPA: hypothetical protein VEJ23_04250, partial [Solirubrobacteraceae bacterium]|nr:hypothetical protein [Solirubrobacteraceae bacterium]